MLAGAITFPPVLPIHVYLIMETVVNCDIGSSEFVDAMHVTLKLWSMAVVILWTINQLLVSLYEGAL